MLCESASPLQLQELLNGLDGAVRVLRPRGRLVTITFHSKEHRIVKKFVDAASREGVCRDAQSPSARVASMCDPANLCAASLGFQLWLFLPTGNEANKLLELCTTKELSPSSEEVHINRRARSARLLALQRTSAPYMSILPHMVTHGGSDR